MSSVVISRTASVTALGSGVEPLWQGLLAGESGIAPVKRFATGNYISNLAAGIDTDAPQGGSRLDPWLAEIATQLGELPKETRLLLASTKGEIDRLDQALRNGEQIPAAVLFEPLLAKVAGMFGLEDAGLNINAACASSTIAIARAAALIASGACESVLVYAADLVSEFVFSGFSALQALSPEPCRPFDCERSGLNLGEGAVALLLQSETAAREQGETPLAKLAGWGAANDAHHVTAPARDGSGLIKACEAALLVAGLPTESIAAINAHGTATPYNDAMELTAFNALFAERLPPLHGIKGSLGHCLGAAGGLEVAVACQALRQQLLPGTVGCRQAEESAQGRISAQAQKIDGDYLLCTNSGFGGINGALILGRVD